MGDVGFAGLAVLAVMTFVGEGVGLPNGVGSRFGQVGGYPVNESPNGF